MKHSSACASGQRPSAAQLRIAGWLGAGHRAYAESVFQRLEAAGCGQAYRYEGEVDRRQKIEFLQQIDLLCVPTTYREPKGLYVLEALAAGVPVVQPAHGSFPELLEATRGGRLVPPGDQDHLVETLFLLLTDHALRRELAERGRKAVHQTFHAQAMAQATLEVYRKVMDAHRSPAAVSSGSR